ncbi:hypothetical protein BDN72DRAFT_833685 [Pluteus cervinus]|uniref:Uncharacterized protein n=1 Tax=Pluteus cervinus TaxID=181527 RepID=A0ACD3B7N8_9AGAR|nr:hypothetical protein BDN72DRAFT_833685 [Pluteus cervinus]
MRSSILRQSALDAFPAELLDLILSENRPNYDFFEVEKGSTRRWRKPAGWKQYLNAVYTLAQLRAVSKSWYNFITPLLYNKFVLPTHPEDEFKRIGNALALHPDLVHHLVIRGLGGDGADHQASKRLCACLSMCTNVRNLEIVDPKRILWHGSEGKGLKIFRSLPPTMPLKSLVLRFLDEPDATVFATSTILVGLGDLVKGLVELEIHKRVWSEMGDPRQVREKLKLPAAFPNLERLYVSGGLDMNAMQLGRLFSRIVRVENPTAQQPQDDVAMGVLDEGKPKPTAAGKTTSPLRDLTLCKYTYERITRPEVITNILTTNNLGMGLTTLRIRLRPTWNGTYQLETFPYIIIKHCPALTTLLYMIPCPEHFLKSVPATISTLGILISPAQPRPPYPWLAPQVAEQLSGFICSADALIEYICRRGSKKGLKNLIVGWDKALRYQRQREPEILEEACWVAGMTFSTDPGF